MTVTRYQKSTHLGWPPIIYYHQRLTKLYKHNTTIGYIFCVWAKIAVSARGDPGGEAGQTPPTFLEELIMKEYWCIYTKYLQRRRTVTRPHDGGQTP